MRGSWCGCSWWVLVVIAQAGGWVGVSGSWCGCAWCAVRLGQAAILLGLGSDSSLDFTHLDSLDPHPPPPSPGTCMCMRMCSCSTWRASTRRSRWVGWGWEGQGMGVGTVRHNQLAANACCPLHTPAAPALRRPPISTTATAATATNPASMQQISPSTRMQMPPPPPPHPHPFTLTATSPPPPLHRLQISLYINSPGGVVTAGLAIYDTMQYIRCPVGTLAVGQAASMASLLLAAGQPGQRRTLPHRCAAHACVQECGVGDQGWMHGTHPQLVYTTQPLALAAPPSPAPPAPSPLQPGDAAPALVRGAGSGLGHRDRRQGNPEDAGPAQRAVRAAHRADAAARR